MSLQIVSIGRVSRYYRVFCINCDEQLTFIVRVMFRPNIKSWDQDLFLLTLKVLLNCYPFIKSDITQPNSTIPLVKLVFCHLIS